MKLLDLCRGFKNQILSDFEKQKTTEVAGLAFDAREVGSNFAFFCLKGTNADGHNFAKQAEQNGASVVFVEREVEGLNVPQVVVKNTREALSIASCNFFGNPSRKMKMVGITGTNGKTSSTYILQSILNCAGKKVGVIGTNGVFFDGKQLFSGMTTPDPIFLNQVLYDMAEANTDVCVMEVSAHALELCKVSGIFFDVAEFTNLTQDHLDFFADMEQYGRAKQKLFEPHQSGFAIANADDAFCNKLLADAKIPFVTFSRQGDASICVKEKIKGEKTRLKIDVLGKTIETNTSLCGDFNVSNILGAVGVAFALGASETEISQGIELVEPVPGRFNVFDLGDNKTAVIDFAHTPDGMVNILRECKKLAQNKLVCLFGCGGNRDRLKRPIMGQIAGELSDKVFLTTDNPRFEDPKQILQDIAFGAFNKNAEVVVVEDRKQAILQAFNELESGDVLAILGKGEENYIEIAGQKYSYSDKAVLKEILSKREEQRG